MSATTSSLVTTNSVREYFLDAFDEASERQSVTLAETTRIYVVNLLTTHCDARELRKYADSGTHHKPLAIIYAEALDAPGPELRNQTLQQLGDLALFVAGIFADSLNRKLVDVDYYVGMGATAYSTLHNSLQQSNALTLHPDLFAELGQKFGSLVDVLAEISENSGMKSNNDTLRTYELWRKTGSERARKSLARNGILPISNASDSTQH